jgi:TPR repeat protein
MERLGKDGRSFASLTRLAENGHTPAQTTLADWLASEGKTAEAIGWYHRAMFQDPHTAMFNLAITYRDIGRVNDYVYWMTKLSNLGDRDAREELDRFLGGAAK